MATRPNRPPPTPRHTHQGVLGPGSCPSNARLPARLLKPIPGLCNPGLLPRQNARAQPVQVPGFPWEATTTMRAAPTLN